MSQAPPPEDRALPVEDPRLVPFLPLIYVAWSDGDLTPDEIREICRRIDRREDIDHDCREVLARWLDPEQPPAAADLQRMLSVIRRYADAPGSPSLTDLGVELSRLDQRVQGVERQALEEVEQALGLATHEAARHLLADGRPQPEAPAAGTEPTFDVDTLARLLDDSHHELREEVRRLLSTEPFAYEPELDRAAYREKVLRLVRILADHGYGGLSFPEATGGRGDMGAFIAVFETLAYGDLSVLVKFGVQFGLFGGSILQLGTEDHHRRYLADIASLELPGCFAMSETGHGSNVRDIETVARYDVASESFIIQTPDPSARKDWIGNAARDGHLATVFAQLEIGAEGYGVHAFLVPIRDAQRRPLPGVEIEDCGHKLGLNGVDNGRLGFHQVSIPRANLLDRFASVAADGTYESPIPSAGKRFFTMLGTLVGGRVSVALGALSAAKSGLTIAVRYGDRRRQFGPAGEAEVRILDYLSHQRRLLPRLATTYALHFGLRHLARRYEESTSDNRREVETLAAGLKSYSSWHTIDTLQACRECCGGKGYLTENRFAALKADTDVFATFEGDNTVLLQLVAKGLLSGYRRQFGEMNVFDMVRYVAERAATGLAELNPVITRRSDEEHLRDRDFQLAALRWREDHLLGSVARRLKKRIDDGMDSFQAMIQVQDHLLKLALAHVERVLLEQFAAALEACEDEALREVLTDVCDLFALARLEADRGWYLSQGYVEAGKSKAIRNLVNDLCRKLRPQAVPLVDAFAIPDEVLAAPIAT
jgi:acyl-CoA oxidase